VARELPPYLQCVPYARQVSGINIFGDAHTWWDQAEGRYSRGHKPKVGAVMAFRPHGNMRLGHVAAVSRVVDSRTVLLRHANWSPIEGRRGQIENDVTAIDVSPNNDWSEVRVWYAPLQDIGTTAWPVAGFIYGDRSSDRPDRTTQIAAETPRRAPAAGPAKSRDVVADIIGRNS
jgi:surface antigen